MRHNRENSPIYCYNKLFNLFLLISTKKRRKWKKDYLENFPHFHQHNNAKAQNTKVIRINVQQFIQIKKKWKFCNPEWKFLALYEQHVCLVNKKRIFYCCIIKSDRKMKKSEFLWIPLKEICSFTAFLGIYWIF